MGKLYVPSKARTAVDHVRKALDQAEHAIHDLSDTGPQALELLYLLDRIDEALQELQAQDVDVRVERTRFETIQRQLERSKGRFLDGAGEALKAEREISEPPRSHWWWYLDEAASRERRRRWWRLAAGAAIIVALVASGWLAYRQFLAPPPEVSQAFQRMEGGRSEAAEGDLRAALEDFSAATELTPEDPEPWLWKGAIHQQLQEGAEAGDAFTTAESLYDTSFDFVLNRGRVYLQLGDFERAKADVKAAIELEPTSGWGYYLRAGIAATEGDYVAAMDDLRRADELAQQNGNRRLQALARTQQAQLVQMLPLATPE